jgi:hypothetical protein
MKIRNFLILCLVIGFILTSFLLYRYIVETKISKVSDPIENYLIRDVSCSFSYKMGSGMVVLFQGKEYIVDLPRDLCKDIEDGFVKPELYYSSMNDSLFIKGYNFQLVSVLISFIFSIILPLIGFIVYRNELDNNYNTM